MLRLSREHQDAAYRGASMAEKRFPGVIVWWGVRTGLWLALVPTGQGRMLVEASSLDGLAGLLQRWEASR
ncbi:hypothetical protein GCM10010439_60650 [Actinocorallia aurantiaca]|uniref:Uncharacterized protein n=1 Tax=Actinocorallia aurantiaca TaxID=46204 RepID=A0ABP6H207_9ACTN